jgi:hypothetical protein
MAFAVTRMRLDGCLFAPPSERDYRVAFRDHGVPERVDLRQYCTRVEDQGQIGSCTANAAVGALEYHYKRRDGHSPDLSRMFVYFNTRRMRGQVMFDTGAQIREAMASLLAFGACREEIWPYNPMLFAMEPPPVAYNDAALHEAIQYARVNGGQGTITALAQGLPVVFGTAIPQRCFEEAVRDGVVPMLTPEELDRPRQGGHAMLIVGYDNRDRVFIVRNSWGESWGDHGYCYIPYDVIDACSPAEEFWLVAALEKETGFQLIRPGRTSAARDGGHDGAARLRARAESDGGIAGTAAKMREQIRSCLEADLAAASRKVDGLLGKTAGGGVPRAAGVPLLPCTACSGSGICPYCRGRKCARCAASGTCSECGGTGTV